METSSNWKQTYMMFNKKYIYISSKSRWIVLRFQSFFFKDNFLDFLRHNVRNLSKYLRNKQIIIQL